VIFYYYPYFIIYSDFLLLTVVHLANNKKSPEDLIYLLVSATFRILQKGPVSQICVVPFSNLGNLIAFGLLRLRRLYYI